MNIPIDLLFGHHFQSVGFAQTGPIWAITEQRKSGNPIEMDLRFWSFEKPHSHPKLAVQIRGGTVNSGFHIASSLQSYVTKVYARVMCQAQTQHGFQSGMYRCSFRILDFEAHLGVQKYFPNHFCKPTPLRNLPRACKNPGKAFPSPRWPGCYLPSSARSSQPRPRWCARWAAVVVGCEVVVRVRKIVGQRLNTFLLEEWYETKDSKYIRQNPVQKQLLFVAVKDLRMVSPKFHIT